MRPRRRTPRIAAYTRLFEDRPEARPTRVAVESNGSAINYGDLNRRANRLAHRLRAVGVQRDSIVAVGGDRSIDVIVGLLGVLKSGRRLPAIQPARATSTD